MIQALDFRGPTFEVVPDELPSYMLNDLLCCCPAGEDAEPRVRAFMDMYRVTGSQPDCRAFLRPYGAWEEHELQDHQTNLMRLVWLTSCALAEGELAYFSTTGG